MLNPCVQKQTTIRRKERNNMVVSGQDIVNSAYKLLGAPYRFWTAFAPLPMWANDGQGDPPPADYLVNGPGVMCADLVSWAMMDNGLNTVFGTQTFEGFLENSTEFSLDSPQVSQVL
jgi:hypothetical protein